MAKPPIFRRIVREDIPDAPQWIDIFIVSLNQFFDSVRLALNRQLTFTENNNMQTKTFHITAGATAADNAYEFEITMTKKVEGLIIGKVEQVETNYTPLTSVPWINWHQESTSLVIESILGLTNTETYNITVTLY